MILLCSSSKLAQVGSKLAQVGLIVVTLGTHDGATSPVVCMRRWGMSAFMVAEIWARGLVSREDNDKKKEHQHAQSDALLGSRGVNPSLFIAIFP